MKKFLPYLLIALLGIALMFSITRQHVESKALETCQIQESAMRDNAIFYKSAMESCMADFEIISANQGK